MNKGPLKNWQYLFVIEGALTCFIALIAWAWLPSGPGSAWFLNATEKATAVERMLQDSNTFVSHEYDSNGVERDRLRKIDAIEAAKDWKVWFALVANICASVPNGAFSVFLPLVVQGLGYESLQANIVSEPSFFLDPFIMYCMRLLKSWLR